MREVSPKIPHPVWLHWYEISRIGKSIETGNRSGAEDSGTGDMVIEVIKGMGWWKGSKIDCSDDYTTLWLY